jgi:hypothetical protein
VKEGWGNTKQNERFTCLLYITLRSRIIGKQKLKAPLLAKHIAKGDGGIEL